MKIADTFKNMFKKKIVAETEDVLLKALLENQEIGKNEAMSLPKVASSVDFISSTIAMLPIKLYKENNGCVTEAKDTRVNLLNDDTKDTLTGYQLKKALVEDFLLDKGAYVYITKIGNQVKKLSYIEPCKISIMKNTDPINKKYRLSLDGVLYEPHEFIKILRNTKDGSQGESVITQVSKAIETAYQSMIYQLSLLKTGGNKRGFLKSENKISEEAMKQLKNAWEKLYSNNESNIVVLNQGVDFVESSNTSLEMQLNETKTTLNQEIDAIFHIKSNFNETIKEAVLPILANIECSLNRDLLLEKEKEHYFFAFDVKELLKGSTKERYEAYKIAKETGFLTLNEIRYLENYDKIEGLDIISMSLGNVIYDTQTHQYFVPNTDSTTKIEEGGEKN